MGQRLTGSPFRLRGSAVDGGAPGVVLDWADLVEVTGLLSRLVAADGVPDVVVGILRGGLVPAVLVAHTLGLRDVRGIDVTHTAMEGVDADKMPHPAVRNPASLGDLTGLDTLVVDDVAGSGASVAATTELVRAAGAAKIRTAVCVVNEINWFRNTDGDPGAVLTYIGRRCQGWVVFPWEQQ
ncbi:MAG: phosphoribosyltransferase [Pseudonocardiaceae bacterium]